MLHHLSIPARDPQGAATALADLLGGDVTPFGPVPGAFIAWARDDNGTAIDCLPLGTELRPGENDDEAQFAEAEHASPFGATHAALSVDRSEEEIRAVATGGVAGGPLRPRLLQRHRSVGRERGHAGVPHP